MLEVKHSEEALGGFDNTAPHKARRLSLRHGTLPGSTCVLNKAGLSHRPRVGPGRAELSWNCDWNYDWDSDRALKGGSSDGAVTFTCQHACVSSSSQAQSWVDLEGLQQNNSYTVEVQAVTYWGQVRLKSSKASLYFSTTQNNESGKHWC